MTSQTDRQASEHLVSRARSDLTVGDLAQASENGWGAAPKS